MAHYDLTDKHFHHSMHGINPPMGHQGHDYHKMIIEDFKKRFFVTLIITIPVMVLSQAYGLTIIFKRQAKPLYNGNEPSNILSIKEKEWVISHNILTKHRNERFN